MRFLNRLQVCCHILAGGSPRPPAKPIPTRYLGLQDWRANGPDVFWLREAFQDPRFQRFVAALRGGVAQLMFKVETEQPLALAAYYRQVGHEDVFRMMVDLQTFEPELPKPVPLDYSGTLEDETTEIHNTEV